MTGLLKVGGSRRCESGKVVAASRTGRRDRTDGIRVSALAVMVDTVLEKRCGSTCMDRINCLSATLEHTEPVVADLPVEMCIRSMCKLIA